MWLPGGNRTMIICFVGTVGGGKTLSMTIEAYKYHLRGMKIYSNYGLNFPHEKLTKTKFDALIANKTDLQDCVICIDEVHIWLDSRSSMKGKQKAITYFILQTRKRNVRFLCSTQHFHQVDKRLRDTTDVIVYCSNMTNKTSLVTKEQVLILQEYMFQYSKSPAKKRVLHANKWFPLFDTTEIIDMTED